MENKKLEVWRQGDVLIFRANTTYNIDKPVERENGQVVLAHGEITGHRHQISEPTAKMFSLKDAEHALDKLLVLEKPSALNHEEHSTINLPAGDFIVRRQREFLPEGDRIVAD